MRNEIAERRKPIRELRKQIEQIDGKLKRYFDAFESGSMEAADVNERIRQLNREKALREAELDERMSVTAIPADALSQASIEALQAELKAWVHASPVENVKRWLNTILDRIVLNGDQVEVVGKTAGIMGILDTKEKARITDVTAVRTSCNKWQPVCSANAYFEFGFDVSRNLLNHNTLRFNPIQTAEWLRELMAEDTPPERRRVAKEVGISRPRVYQFLDLLKLPARERDRCGRNPDLREYHLRRITLAS